MLNIKKNRWSIGDYLYIYNWYVELSDKPIYPTDTNKQSARTDSHTYRHRHGFINHVKSQTPNFIKRQVTVDALVFSTSANSLPQSFITVNIHPSNYRAATTFTVTVLKCMFRSNGTPRFPCLWPQHHHSSNGEKLEVNWLCGANGFSGQNFDKAQASITNVLHKLNSCSINFNTSTEMHACMCQTTQAININGHEWLKGFISVTGTYKKTHFGTEKEYYWTMNQNNLTTWQQP